jgi:hypothetical protein
MNKITLDIIKQFKNAFKFYKNVTQESLDLYLNSETKQKYSKITWLYESSSENFCLIGIQNNVISAIDSEGCLVGVCDGIENIPYELLREESKYADDELVQDVFNCDIELQKDFFSYESWCKENDIELDKQRVYHDLNGKLFEKYFEKDN